MATFYITATFSTVIHSTNSNTVEGAADCRLLAAEKTAVLPALRQQQYCHLYRQHPATARPPLPGSPSPMTWAGTPLRGDPGAPHHVEGSLKCYSTSVRCSPPRTVTAGDPLVIGGITVSGGRHALLIMQAEPNGCPCRRGTITNTASITGNGLTIPLTAQATVAAGETLRLSISKCIGPTGVVENGTVTLPSTCKTAAIRPPPPRIMLSLPIRWTPSSSGLTAT